LKELEEQFISLLLIKDAVVLTLFFKQRLSDEIADFDALIFIPESALNMVANDNLLVIVFNTVFGELIKDVKNSLLTPQLLEFYVGDTLFGVM
jgi:hypothetical protein